MPPLEIAFIKIRCWPGFEALVLFNSFGFKLPLVRNAEGSLFIGGQLQRLG
jgi:hypothetical protein